MEYRYKIIRSARRTLAATIKDGIVIVRAPLRLPDSEIIDFLRKHKNWIQKNLVKAQEMEKQMGEPLTIETIQMLAEQALKEIPPRVNTMRICSVSHMAG